MQFEERTIKIIIDESKCLGCKTHACAAGCKLFDRGILVIKDGKPAVAGDVEFAKRTGTECWHVSMNVGLEETKQLPLRLQSLDWKNTKENMESFNFRFQIVDCKCFY